MQLLLLILIALLSCGFSVFSVQLSELKRAAEEYMNQILAQLQSEAATRGGNGAGAGRGRSSRSSSSSREDPQVQQLKGKIKNAIMAMQEGLVERDVEVRRRGGWEGGKREWEGSRRGAGGEGGPRNCEGGKREGGGGGAEGG